MNYYSHHIGDYLSATAHLTLLEHGAYRRLIDVYYIHESPLPAEKKQVYRLVGARTKEEKEAVDSVLSEFFEEGSSGWMQARCDREIAITNKNRKNGGKGGRPPKNGNPNETQTEPKEEPNGNPNETQTESPRHPSPNHPITGGSLSEQKESTTTTTVTGKNDSSSLSSLSSESSGRAKILAGRLMRLETDRGVGGRVAGSDPRVLAWVAAGVTDPMFREAYDMALTQRLEEGVNTAINAGFLDIFIAKLLNPKGGESAVSAKAKAWHDTASGIEAKGKELGIPPPDPLTGGFPAFKARVFKAAGMIAEAA